MTTDEEQYVAEILKHLKRWQTMAAILRTVHILLGVAAVFCSLLVAAKINSIDKVYLEWLAFTAALSIAIQTSFNLGNKANRFRRAWRIVNASYLKYRMVEEHTISELIDDYSVGEATVGDVTEVVR